MYKKVSYRKQIARQHSWSTSHLGPSLIMQNLVVYVIVRAHVADSKNLGDAGPRPLG